MITVRQHAGSDQEVRRRENGLAVLWMAEQSGHRLVYPRGLGGEKLVEQSHEPLWIRANHAVATFDLAYRPAWIAAQPFGGVIEDHPRIGPTGCHDVGQRKRPAFQRRRQLDPF